MKKIGNLIGALILIGIGLIFLLNNFGYLSWDIWNYLWKLWPLILIAIGLSLLFKNSKLWFLSYLIPIIIAGMVISFAFQYNFKEPESVLATSTLNQRLEDIAKAEIEIDFGAGNLNIGAGSNNLFDGEFKYNNKKFLPNPVYKTKKGIAKLRLKAGSNLRTFHPINEWNLNFTGKIPIDLKVDYGAASAIIDMSDLKVDKLDIDGGATNTELIFGIYPTKADINIGVSKLAIKIPKEVGAKIKLEDSINSVNMDDLEKLDGKEGVYITKNYEDVKNKLDITIDSGVSDINVEVI
ncbi:MAG: toast rack family protein [Methanosarcinales archaeon]